MELAKVKAKFLHAGVRACVTYKGTPISPSADFSAKTLQARRVKLHIQSDKR